MSNCKNLGKRVLLKCFCGCQDLTVEEVKRIYQLNVQATLIDIQATKLFRSYLQQARCGSEKSLAEQYLDVYEQCSVYMLQENKLLTLDELDELSELGLSYYLEKDLREQIRTGVCDNIMRSLLRIQCHCRMEIELSPEYKNYKDAIFRKLK